ncbi:MAG: hypothetical protein ABL982_00200 [Vicinamibacterales bacterium]
MAEDTEEIPFYSREFPKGKGAKRYLLDDIPSELWKKARAKAKRRKVSMRALILRLLSAWVEERGK